MAWSWEYKNPRIHGGRSGGVGQSCTHHHLGSRKGLDRLRCEPAVHPPLNSPGSCAVGVVYSMSRPRLSHSAHGRRGPRLAALDLGRGPGVQVKKTGGVAQQQDLSRSRSRSRSRSKLTRPGRNRVNSKQVRRCDSIRLRRGAREWNLAERRSKSPSHRARARTWAARALRALLQQCRGRLAIKNRGRRFWVHPTRCSAKA